MNILTDSYLLRLVMVSLEHIPRPIWKALILLGCPPYTFYVLSVNAQETGILNVKNNRHLQSDL